MGEAMSLGAMAERIGTPFERRTVCFPIFLPISLTFQSENKSNQPGGQLLLNLFLDRNFTENEAALCVSITLIGISAVLTALGLYEKLGKFCGVRRSARQKQTLSGSL